MELLAERLEAGELVLAIGGVVGQTEEMGGDGFGGELVVEELWNEAVTGDQVGHRDGEVAVTIAAGGDLRRVTDKPAGEVEGKEGDLVDDHEGRADEGGLDGGRAGGDGRGAAVQEGGAGVGEEVDGRCGGGDQGLDPGRIEGGRDGKEELEAGRLGAIKKLRGGEKFGEIGGELTAAAAGQERDPLAVGVDLMGGGEVLARDGGQGESGEGMADKGGGDAAGGVEGLFKRKDDKDATDALLDPAKASSLPGPELGADEPEDGNARAMEAAGEAEVDVGEVDQDGEVRRLIAK